MKRIAFYAPMDTTLSQFMSNSGYVLEGMGGSLCRWQSKLRSHLSINDTHIEKARNNTRQQLARLYHNHPY